MSFNTLFATGISEENHPELAEKSKSLFPDTIFYDVRPGFKTSLLEYGATGRAAIPKKYTLENSLIIKEIEEIVLAQADKFFETAGYTYNKDLFEFKVANLWLNEMEGGSFHPRHIHYGSVLSGCFYVEVPEKCAGIIFYGPLERVDKANLDVKNYTIFNSSTWTLRPEAGNMLMWESYLQHEVPTAEFIGKRRSIAFDVSLDFKE